MDVSNRNVFNWDWSGDCFDLSVDMTRDYPNSLFEFDNCSSFWIFNLKEQIDFSLITETSYSDENWLIERILMPTFSNCRYSSFPVTVYGKPESTDISRINSGDCTCYARYMYDLLKSFDPHIPCFIIPSSAPNLYREPFWPELTHVGLLLAIPTGFILLDPAFLLKKPVYLTEENQYSSLYDWAAEDEFYASTKGLAWRFSLERGKERAEGERDGERREGKDGDRIIVEIIFPPSPPSLPSLPSPPSPLSPLPQIESEVGKVEEEERRKGREQDEEGEKEGEKGEEYDDDKLKELSSPSSPSPSYSPPTPHPYHSPRFSAPSPSSRFFYHLYDCSGSESQCERIGTQLRGLRRRISFVRTDPQGNRLAHLCVRADTMCVESFSRGEWNDRLPLDDIVSVDFLRLWLDSLSLLSDLLPQNPQLFCEEVFAVIRAVQEGGRGREEGKETLGSIPLTSQSSSSSLEHLME